MAVLLLFALVGIIAILRTIAAVRDDRPTAPPRSHGVDPRFLPPASLSRR